MESTRPQSRRGTWAERQTRRQQQNTTHRGHSALTAGTEKCREVCQNSNIQKQTAATGTATEGRGPGWRGTLWSAAQVTITSHRPRLWVVFFLTLPTDSDTLSGLESTGLS